MKRLHLTYIAAIVALGTTALHFDNELCQEASAKIEAAYVQGWEEAEQADYWNTVATCYDMTSTPKAHENCVKGQVGGNSKEAGAKVKAEGYRGPLISEVNFTSKEKAVAYMNGKGWDIADAKIEGDAMLWENFPRTLKVSPTKKGWALSVTLANIEPEAAQ
ncbi:hypothetical protein AH4AK4_2799 [Aeromonas hydrophila 4AK4]|nr:hypothetical protein AH4AK4_2799 [Aeromonas hydrophila 4AK4]